MSITLSQPRPRHSHAGIPGPLLAIVIGAFGGGVAGLLLSTRSDSADSVRSLALGAVIGLIVTLFAVVEWVGSRRYRLARTVPLDPEAVQVHAARWFGGPPWSLSRQQPGELVFWRRLEPNILTALVLLMFGIVPGVIYLAFSRGTQTLALRIEPSSTGTDLEILVQPQGNDGRRAVSRFFNSLHDL